LLAHLKGVEYGGGTAINLFAETTTGDEHVIIVEAHPDAAFVSASRKIYFGKESVKQYETG